MAVLGFELRMLRTDMGLTNHVREKHCSSLQFGEPCSRLITSSPRTYTCLAPNVCGYYILR
jgi:hypothetical protein